jgi:hypothetical protein
MELPLGIHPGPSDCGGLFRNKNANILGCFALNLVTLAFKSHSVVPWKLKNRWLNCLNIVSNMSFIVSYIFWEGTHCAGKLAHLGLSISDCIWFDQCHALIKDDFIKNRISLPYFRFS